MIRIDINTQQLTNMIGAINARQIPFAAARALTKTAMEVQSSVRKSMPQRFTIRRQWVVQGIRIIPASKNNLTAVVYSKDPFMARQETGGVKTGKAGGGNFTSASLPQNPGGKNVRNIAGRVAIPTEKVLRTKSEIVRKSELPSGLGAKAFVIGNKGETQLLARRFAKGKRAGLQILYVLKRRTFVKPRLGLREIGEKVVNRRFGKIFSESLQNAIATARKT